MSFCSSVNLRRKRHKLETSARGPPSRKNIMKKIMPPQGSGERNVYIIRPMNERLFQLPIPPMTKPRMEEALRSGRRFSHRDLRATKNILIDK